MKIAIIVFVVLSLFGSMMWMMPSPREKMLAKLRLAARKVGFTVQLIQVEPPRAQGEYESDKQSVAAYRLLREKSSKAKLPEPKPWQVFRVNAIANEGLPEGWSWKVGERSLNAEQLDTLCAVIDAMPTDVMGLESTPLHVSAYWLERSGEQSMEALKQLLEKLKAVNI